MFKLKVFRKWLKARILCLIARICGLQGLAQVSTAAASKRRLLQLQVSMFRLRGVVGWVSCRTGL